MPIISFGLRHPPRLLHGNFVAALLSDLFGIQARSGCFCAGPYLHRAYRIDKDFSQAMGAQCARGQLGIKLAFARVGFNYFISEHVFQYILEAVHLLADHGARLLPLYRFDPASGLWRHRDAPQAPTLRDAAVPRRTRSPDRALAGQLAEARRIINELAAGPRQPAATKPILSPDLERIRWFPL
ncbi:MAG: hypothetical protein JO363_08015 [Solirubrobacterales bacterium]|nr:hypothetical protein [Solirubrobacterales bacterium]